MKDGAEPLKYLCLNKEIKDEIDKYRAETNPKVFDYIDSLLALIEYQMVMIHQERREVISLKHNKAWHHYDKDVIGKNLNNRPNFGC